MPNNLITYIPDNHKFCLTEMSGNGGAMATNAEDLGVGVVGHALADVMGVEATNHQAKELIEKLRMAGVVIKFKEPWE